MRLFAAVAFAIPVLAAASTTTFIVRELVSSLTTRQGSVEGLDPCVSLCGSQTLVGNSAAQECLAMTDFEAGIACVCGNNALVSSMTTCLKRECDNPDQVIALLCPDVVDRPAQTAATRPLARILEATPVLAPVTETAPVLVLARAREMVTQTAVQVPVQATAMTKTLALALAFEPQVLPLEHLPCSLSRW
ncbi:hypothetical protein BKA62DRAFT_701750 [Auriculariales sp. MPI-PUGE-AT-0066]|nr:hypothetical protein BKA62DRAFT_701750 [Auriculariales sp. MPI-PUGE-AT-0066]